MSSLKNIPTEPPPPGQLSNFEDPESRGPAIVAVCSIFLSLMWPIFLSRLYSKIFILRTFGWDDVFAGLGAIGATAFAASTIWLIAVKLIGPHAWDVRAAVESNNAIRVITIGTGAVNFPLTMIFTKLALFLLYYRLFASHRGTKIAIYLGIVINCLYYVSIVIAYCVMCIPRPGETWFSKKCPSPYIQNYVQAAFNVVSDLWIFVLPLPVLSSLQMPLRRKLGVAATFGTGLIAIIASAISLYYRILEWSTSNDFPNDFTWRVAPTFGLAVVEASVGVICSSVPYIPALFRHRRPHLSHINHWLHGLLCGWKIRPKKSPGLSLHDCRHSNPKATALPRMQVKKQVLNSTQRGGNLVWSRLTELSGNIPPCHNARATRRDQFERPISAQVVSSDDLAQSYTQNVEVSPEFAAGEHSGGQSGSRQRGYWDVMSIFRSGKNNSTTQSESYSRAQPGDPDSTNP